MLKKFFIILGRPFPFGMGAYRIKAREVNAG